MTSPRCTARSDTRKCVYWAVAWQWFDQICYNMLQSTMSWTLVRPLLNLPMRSQTFLCFIQFHHYETVILPQISQVFTFSDHKNRITDHCSSVVLIRWIRHVKRVAGIVTTLERQWNSTRHIWGAAYIVHIRLVLQCRQHCFWGRPTFLLPFNFPLFDPLLKCLYRDSTEKQSRGSKLKRLGPQISLKVTENYTVQVNRKHGDKREELVWEKR
jgi:hypothetical protein